MANHLVEQIAQAVVARVLPYLANGNGSKPPAQPPMQKRSFTVREVAVYVGRSPTAIYRLVAKRQIPFVRNARTIRFLKDDIDRWLERDRV